jgi:hypothetical protein
MCGCSDHQNERLHRRGPFEVVHGLPCVVGGTVGGGMKGVSLRPPICSPNALRNKTPGF